MKTLSTTGNPGEQKLPRKKICGIAMKVILRMCGKNPVQFARFIGRSDNFVRQTLGYNHDFIPFEYYDALRVFVGDENFYCSLRELGIEP